MEQDIVLSASQRSGLTPWRIFFLAYRESKEEAKYHHHEWLIYDTTSERVELFVLHLVSRHHQGGGYGK